MKVILMVVLSGCITPILEIRQQIMMDSLVFCASQYGFFASKEDSFWAGLDTDDMNVHVGRRMAEAWDGIMTDPAFREHLHREGITSMEFQQAITACQTDFMERHRYFEMIQGGPPRPRTY